MNLDQLVFAPVLLPLLGAAFCFFAKAFLHSRWAKTVEYLGVFIGLIMPWLFFIQCFSAVFSGYVFTGVVGSWDSGVGINYSFDGLSWLVNILGFSVGAAAWFYSLGGGPKGPAFSAIFLIQTAALAATVMTSDLFNLFVCLEVLGIASYILVASSDKPGAALASFSYLMVSATAMVFFLLGLYGLYRLTGSLSYEGIAAGLSRLPDGGGAPAVISLALIVAAVAMRVAVMPLYGWLPDAHALAPHAISAVLSGVLIKTPLFALSRILLLMPAGALAGQLMGYAGAGTALVAVIIALSQKDAKRLLAYHSISQIGYIVAAWGAAIAVGVSTKTGILLMSASFLHALYHALFKGLLFLTVGTTVDTAQERNVYLLRGANRFLRKFERFPVTMLCFFVGALSISAIPPFNGFASKAAISYALKGTPHYVLLYIAGIGTVASFIKLSRIFWPVSKKSRSTIALHSVEPAAEQQMITSVSVKEPQPITWTMKVSQLFLAVLCIAGGIQTPHLFPLVLRLIAGNGVEIQTSIQFFSADAFMKTAIITVFGALLFFLATTQKGSAVLRIVRERPRNFQGLFVSFSLGTAALAFWMLL